MPDKSGKRHGWLRKVLNSLGVVVILVTVGAGVMLLLTEDQRRQDKDLPITDVDFSKVPDGEYRGSYEGWNEFRVLVSVVDGKVTDIVITDDSPSPATGATDGVLERVVRGQSLDVDAVSGATVTTKGLLKAVEQALVEHAQ